MRFSDYQATVSKSCMMSRTAADGHRVNCRKAVRNLLRLSASNIDGWIFRFSYHDKGFNDSMSVLGGVEMKVIIQSARSASVANVKHNVLIAVTSWHD